MNKLLKLLLATVMLLIVEISYSQTSYQDSKGIYYTNSSEVVNINTFETESKSISSLDWLSDAVTVSELNYNSYRDELMFNIIDYFNTPYLWGGQSKNGIDCSAFVQTVMYKSYGIKLPRTSLEQSTEGITIPIDSLQFGDLLFFDTKNAGRVTHVAIYLENNLFVHSGSKTGVAIAMLNSEFYGKTFLYAKRVL